MQIKPRKIDFAKLERELIRLAEKRPGAEIFLSFTSDPYQPLEHWEEMTQKALILIGSVGLRANVLTKNPQLALCDLDCFKEYDFKIGTTLTALDSRQWEPKAPSTQQRISAIKQFADEGVKTWVSFEPVIYPEETLTLIPKVAGFVDMIKVGTLNHRKEAKQIDWPKFAREVKELLDSLGVDYYLKEDLRKHL